MKKESNLSTSTNDIVPKKQVKGVDYDVRVSSNGSTVWVDTSDGSTVGRFSKIFGMDVHTTVTQQLEGKSQCLACTHDKPTRDDWLLFCSLIADHYAIHLSIDLITFDDEIAPASLITRDVKKSSRSSMK
jgi:hypothetical protein